MKKRIVAVIFTVAITTGMVAGCGKQNTDSVIEEIKELIETETQEAEEETETGFDKNIFDNDQKSDWKIYVDKRHEEFKDSTGTAVLLTLDTACPIAEGEGMENLSAAFDGWYEGEMNSIMPGLKDMKKGIEEEYRMSLEATEDGSEGYFFNPYDISEDVTIERADEKLTSISSTYYSYTGGAHGDSYTNGTTFDTATGEQMKLSDLMESMDAYYTMAESYAVSYVETVYGKDGLYDDYESSLETLVQDPVWYMGSYGVCIVCNEYMIGPHAMGTVIITLPYKELDGILKPEYMPENDSFAYKFAENELVTADDSGLKISVTTEKAADDPDSAGAIILNYGDESAQVTDFGEYLGQMYVIRQDGNHVYVLINVDYASDDYHTFLMQVGSEGIRACDYLDAGISYNDPVTADGFTLTSRVDVLGTYGGNKYYTIDENGKMITEDEIFSFHNGKDAPYQTSLTAIADIPAVIDGKDTVIGTGTVIYPSGCDLDGAFYFDMEDGTEGSLQYETKEDYGVTIQGKDENELFEMIPYAG